MTHKILHVEMNGTCRGCPYLQEGDRYWICRLSRRDFALIDYESDGDGGHVSIFPSFIPHFCRLPNAAESEADPYIAAMGWELR